MLLVVVSSGHWVGIPRSMDANTPIHMGQNKLPGAESKLASKFSHCDNDACATGIPNLDPDGAFTERSLCN